MLTDKRVLNGPIPGQSLTSTPGNAPYERPPEYTKPEDAANFHLNRLAKKDQATAVVDALELGVDVKTLTQGIIRGAVSEGIHSIDVGLLISPLIHEKIVNIAKAADVDFEEGLKQSEDRSEIDFAINKRKVDKMMQDMESQGEAESTSEDSSEDREEPKGFMMPTNKAGV